MGCAGPSRCAEQGCLYNVHKQPAASRLPIFGEAPSPFYLQPFADCCLCTAKSCAKATCALPVVCQVFKTLLLLVVYHCLALPSDLFTKVPSGEQSLCTLTNQCLVSAGECESASCLQHHCVIYMSHAASAAAFVSCWLEPECHLHERASLIVTKRFFQRINAI